MQGASMLTKEAEDEHIA
jgi:hypothetical protein